MSKYELLCILHKLTKNYVVRFKYNDITMYLMDFSKWTKKAQLSDYSASHIITVECDEIHFTELTIIPR